MSFKAGVCGTEYHNIDGTGWPDAVVVDNGGDIFEHAYETRVYFPVDREALLALAGELSSMRPCEVFDRRGGTEISHLIREALGVES